jgi:hypothetical protein
LGSTIDLRISSAEAFCSVSSSAGPDVPALPASASAWQPPQFCDSKTARPAEAWSPPWPAWPGALDAAGVPPPSRSLARRASKSSRADHPRGLAHVGVAQPAQLGADDRVVARRVGVTRKSVTTPGDGVDLHAEGRDPEVVDDVLGADEEPHRLALGQVQLRRADRLAAGLRVLERPGELLADDVDAHLVGLRLLDVGEDDVGVGAQPEDDRRRDQRPDDLQARVAVDGRARRAAPGPGASGTSRRSRGRSP